MFSGIMSKILLGLLLASLIGSGALGVKLWLKGREVAKLEQANKELQNIAIQLRADLAAEKRHNEAVDKGKQVKKRVTHEKESAEAVGSSGDSGAVLGWWRLYKDRHGIPAPPDTRPQPAPAR